MCATEIPSPAGQAQATPTRTTPTAATPAAATPAADTSPPGQGSTVDYDLGYDAQGWDTQGFRRPQADYPDSQATGYPDVGQDAGERNRRTGSHARTTGMRDAGQPTWGAGMPGRTTAWIPGGPGGPAARRPGRSRRPRRPWRPCRSRWSRNSRASAKVKGQGQLVAALDTAKGPGRVARHRRRHRRAGRHRRGRGVRGTRRFPPRRWRAPATRRPWSTRATARSSGGSAPPTG